MRPHPGDRLARLRSRPAPDVDDEPGVGDELSAIAAVRGWSLHGRCMVTGGAKVCDGDGVRMIALEAPRAAHERLQTIKAVHEPHLVRVLEIVDAPRLVVMEDADGVGLDELVRIRGSLVQGETAMVGTSIGLALAALHAAGVAYGPLGMSDVVVAAEGSVRLRVRPDVMEGRLPADDIADLARLLQRVGGASTALARIVTDAQDPVPWSRPDAAAFAVRCRESVEPCAVRVPERADLAAALSASRSGNSVPERRDELPRRSDVHQTRRSRPWWITAAITVVGLAAIGVGVNLILLPPDRGSSVEPNASVESTTPVEPVETKPANQVAPATAAADLTIARLKAVGGSGDIADVTVPESDAALRDREFMESLIDRGIVFDGLTGAVLEADDISGETSSGHGAGGDQARVRVRYQVAAHQQTIDGTTQSVDAQEQTDVLVLVMTNDGWRVREIE